VKIKNHNHLEDGEFNNFLESIGGLENGFYTDKEPIKNTGFFCIGNGWLGVVRSLIEDLIELGWDKQICQVKEKFGGLRFYINSGSDEIYKKIFEAEMKSNEICEKCGEPGKSIKGGWIVTLCEFHAEEKLNK
jgi:hypothetical protein